MEIKPTLKYITAGLLAGGLNGFFGGGGGMVLLPLYIGWAKMDSRTAFATSVASIFPMCAVSAGVYLMKGGFTLTDALPYLAGGLIGGIIGGLSFKKLPMSFLRKLFALLVVWGGIRYVL